MDCCSPARLPTSVAVKLHILRPALVPPAEADHRRESVVGEHEGIELHIRIDKTLIGQLRHEFDRFHVAGLGARHFRFGVAAFHPFIESMAQAFFRGVVPLAVGIDAMDKNDDAEQWQFQVNVEKGIASWNPV